MEFPILTFLPMPAPAIRLVTQFLREPHPTAILIQKLTFIRTDPDYEECDEDPSFPATLLVDGEAIMVCEFTQHRLLFTYNKHTGEPIKFESEVASDSDSTSSSSDDDSDPWPGFSSEWSFD